MNMHLRVALEHGHPVHVPGADTNEPRVVTCKLSKTLTDKSFITAERSSGLGAN